MKTRLKPLLHRCQTRRPNLTQGVPDPEFEPEEVRVEPEVRFQRENNFQAAFLSLDDINRDKGPGHEEVPFLISPRRFPSGHR